MKRRTFLAGTILGSVLLAVLTLVGVHMAKPSPRPPAYDGRTDTQMASQPQLEAALLHTADLPPEFQMQAAPSPVVRRSRPLEKCSALLDPSTLIKSTAPKSTASSVHSGPALQQVNQVLAGFGTNEAERAFEQLRQVARGCKSFSTKLADGTAVRVKVENLVAEKGSLALLQLGGESHSVRLTITSPEKTTTSYLAFGRVGALVSVLSQLDPMRKTTLADFTGLVDTAARRLLVAGAR